MLEQIKASAGSGKTYTLTLRFLKELSRLGTKHDALPCHKQKRKDSAAFSEVLAMTFTNKAAAEMKERVLATLKTIALREDDTPDPNTGISPYEARDWVEKILRKYDSLNIRTIDSLLNLLIKISAVNLDIPPDFELTFDEQEFLEPLYDELLDKADQGNAEIRSLLSQCALYLLNTSKSAGLTPRGKIRDMLLEVLGLLHGARLERLPCIDKELLESKQKKLVAALYSELKTLEEQLDIAGIKPSKNFSNFLEKLWNYEIGEKFPESALLGRSSFQDCCNKAEKELVNKEIEAAYEKFNLNIQTINNHLSIYESAISLLPFTKLALLILPEIKRLQKESGQISGSLLPVLAGDILNAENGVSEACCRLGSNLNHILIDEFQDTSRAQWQAILPLAEECLARGGSLRYVGDVKQAIYSWRGGDSSLFDEVVKPNSALTIMEPIPQLTRLEHNWRSSPEVVNHNNKFFAQLSNYDTAYTVIKALLHKDYPDVYAGMAAQTLAQSFADCEQKIPKKNTDIQGYVRIEKVSGTGQSELQENIKGKLQELFSNILERHRAGDVALLVRNKSEADLSAQWLSEWGIAVVTEHSFKLSGNPIVSRIIALLRWIDYPPDDLSFFNFITSSEVFIRNTTLSPEKILEWANTLHKHETAKQALFRSFQRDFPAEWEVLLEPFYKGAGLMSAYDTVSEIINRYNLFSAAPGNSVYLRRLLELVLGAEKKGYSSISAFLEFWDNKGQEEKIPAPENPDAVHLMTIHKAKGLEFKIVVIPFHRFSGRNDSGATMCVLNNLPMLVKESRALGAQYYLAKNNAAIEIMNLLYVAWTRAGEELYLFVGGSEHDEKTAGLVKALNTLLKSYTFSKDGVYSSGIISNSQKNNFKPDSCVKIPLFSNTPIPTDSNWQPMSWLPKLKIFRAPIPDLQYDERMRGILFHNSLENLYIPNSPDVNLLDIVTRSVAHTIHNFHLPVTHTEDAKKELTNALLWFCSLPQAKDWLSKGLSEQTIMDEHGENHRMDLLIEESDGSLLVLEYKSGQPWPEHYTQVKKYLSLLHKGTGKAVRGLLVYLDSQVLEEVLLNE